jgi:hypothetical protein
MMMGRRAGLVGAGIVALLLTGCTGGHHSASPSSPTATTTAPRARPCPVTAPTDDELPAAIATQNYDAPVYHHGSLWVGAWWAVPESLTEARTADDSDATYPYRQKYPTWTVQNGAVTYRGGAPRLTVTQLGGDRRGSGSAGGYASETMDNGTVASWWPTVVGFPARGCWQVTETVGDDNLVYVVEI